MISIEYLRTFKIGEYAIFDIATSFIGILILSPLLSKAFRLIHLEIPLLSWMYFVFPLSILTHLLTNNMTAMTKYFIDPSGHYLLKIFIVGLLVSMMNSSFIMF